MPSRDALRPRQEGWKRRYVTVTPTDAVEPELTLPLPVPVFAPVTLTVYVPGINPENVA